VLPEPFAAARRAAAAGANGRGGGRDRRGGYGGGRDRRGGTARAQQTPLARAAESPGGRGRRGETSCAGEADTAPAPPLLGNGNHLERARRVDSKTARLALSQRLEATSPSSLLGAAGRALGDVPLNVGGGPLLKHLLKPRGVLPVKMRQRRIYLDPEAVRLLEHLHAGSAKLLRQFTDSDHAVLLSRFFRHAAGGLRRHPDLAHRLFVKPRDLLQIRKLGPR
jgi:hypothetical protein